MLSIHNLHKSYGIQPILQNINLNINTGERAGLIGPNGSGKTTLMRILAGIEKPDSGMLALTPANLRIGYLAQGLTFDDGQTLQSALRLNIVTEPELEAELAALATALSVDPDNPGLQGDYDSALSRLSAFTFQPSSILAPLGLDKISIDTPIAHLSGGQKTRLMLAQVLLRDPQFLLLDEPTNHLDIAMLEWLEDWLTHFQGAALIVSHDRAFLDNTVESILDLNPDTHSIRAYVGNYSEYIEQFLRNENRQLSTWRDQESEIRRMKQDINRTKQQSLRVEMSTTPGTPGVRRIAKKVARKALSREKKLDRYLESDARVEKPKPSWQLKLEFEAGDHFSRHVLQADNLAIGYDTGGPVLTGINLQIRAGQRIALTGPNGSGKTTLIRTLAGKLKPLAGTMKLGAAVKPGYMTQEQELLNPGLSALQTIQSAAAFSETEARNFLHYFLFEDDDPLRPTGELSYGERARLQLGLLVAQGCNFLLLDEPINHLDIPSRARFEEALAGFKGTILAVVHDRYFIEQFASHVWAVHDGKLSG